MSYSRLTAARKDALWREDESEYDEAAIFIKMNLQLYFQRYSLGCSCARFGTKSDDVPHLLVCRWYSHQQFRFPGGFGSRQWSFNDLLILCEISLSFGCGVHFLLVWLEIITRHTHIWKSSCLSVGLLLVGLLLVGRSCFGENREKDSNYHLSSSFIHYRTRAFSKSAIYSFSFRETHVLAFTWSGLAYRDSRG